MNKNSSKEEIINQAIKLHLQGNITEATKFYKYCFISTPFTKQFKQNKYMPGSHIPIVDPIDARIID